MDPIRVLILEDDRDIIDLVMSSLGGRYEFFSASNGREGLQLALLGQPDMIICDVMMPIMDGWEFARRVRLFDGLERVPLVFLSALSSRDNIRNGYELGGALYLTKPVNASRLQRNIELFVEDHDLKPAPKTRTLREVQAEYEEQSGARLRRDLQQKATPAAATHAMGDAPRFGASTVSRPPAGANDTARVAPPPAAPAETTPPPSSRTFSGGGLRPSDTSGRRRSAFPRSATHSPVEKTPPVRILVVEDDRNTRQMLMLALKDRYEVIEAEDGVMAVENAVRYKPDLFIVDAILPRMTGYQATLMLRKNKDFYRSPILMISGKSTARDQEHAGQIGVNRFLAKPFKAQTLIQAVEELIRQPEFQIHRDRIQISPSN